MEWEDQQIPWKENLPKILVMELAINTTINIPLNLNTLREEIFWVTIPFGLPITKIFQLFSAIIYCKTRTHNSICNCDQSCFPIVGNSFFYHSTKWKIGEII